MRYLLILALGLVAACGRPGGARSVTVFLDSVRADSTETVVDAAAVQEPAADGRTVAAADSPAPAAPAAPATASPGKAPKTRQSAAKKLMDKADLAPIDSGRDDPMRTVAGLGDPGRPGLWLETPLVRSGGPGRVVMIRTGRAVRLSLIPSGGAKTAGSRLSLEAYRSLGAPLTQLIELEVYAGG